MKVALVNTNPAVSRLATLSLNKIGYEYVEIDNFYELEGKFFDILILDSDIEVGDVNLENIAGKILYLSSKNSPEFQLADKILPKPFLPTEFISMVESLSVFKDENSEDENDELKEESSIKFEDDEHLRPLEESEFVDELSDDLFKDALDDEKTYDDDFNVEDLEADLSIENAPDEAGEDKEHIDEYEEEPENFDEISDDEQVQITAREEELLKDFGFEDEESKEESSGLDDAQDFKEDDFIKDELGYEDDFDTKIEPEGSAFDTEDTLADIKNTIEEIDSLDDELNLEESKESKEEFSEVSFQDEFKDEENLEPLEENIAEDADLEFNYDASYDEAKESGDSMIENLQDDENLDAAESIDFANEGFKNKDYEISEYDDIDQISEEDLAMALDEKFEKTVETVEAIKSDIVERSSDMKDELTHKISERISGVLDADSIKEALKGLNIKINITFEEK